MFEMTSNVNHQKQVKLKASIEELVGPTLDRVLVAIGTDYTIVKDLIENTKRYLESRQKCDFEIMRICGDIEKQIECCQKNKGAHNKSTSSTKEEILQQNFSIEEKKAENTLLERIWDLNKILLKSLWLDQERNSGSKTETYEVGGPSKTSYQEGYHAKYALEQYMNELRPQERFWLDSLGIFPLYTKLKKRMLFHWWICLEQVPLEGNVNRTSLQLVKQRKMTCLKSILRYVQTGSQKPQQVEQNISKKTSPSISTVEPRCICCKNCTNQLQKRAGGHTVSYHASEGDRIDTTSKQSVERLFDYLVEMGILEPTYREHNQVINQCTIKPTFHRRLRATFWWDQLRLRYKAKTLLNARASREDASCHFLYDHRYNARALLNMDQKYLNSKNIASKNVLGNKNALNVIHLGRWYFTDLENDNTAEEVVSFESQDHIEVDGTDFLKELGENVIFLSLRGISMIDELPESIGKLEYLRIFDLRACHNLTKLPPKPQSKNLMLKSRQESWFNNLTHLDISECYMLNHIPKWICELSKLEVFKGYVAGISEDKKSQFCQLRDITKLNKLRKLSIRIIKPLDPKDARGLESLEWLSILTVSWNINEPNNDKDLVWTISFPKSLEKLDIRCYPKIDAAEQLDPTALPKLKRLYIRGGKIATIAIRNGSHWMVEILRLRFLNSFEIRWCELSGIFMQLKHVEYKRCPKLKYFPDNGGAWNTEKDGPFPEYHEPRPVEMRIRSKYKVPVATNTQKILLELTGWDSIIDRPRLNLVAVLDLSPDMYEYREYLKLAMLFVISKLSSVDRLSIVTVSDEPRTIWPLQQITDSSRGKLKNLVKRLEICKSERVPKNIIDGFRKGLDILKHPEISWQDSCGVILVTCNYIDVDEVSRYINNVSVHVFMADYHRIRREARKYPAYGRIQGGTYSSVSEPEYLIKAFSVCLAGLFTVVAKDLTLTITPIRKLSEVKDISVGDYHRENNATGSVTIKFGDLYSGEIRKVLVTLLLHAVDEPGDAEVLQVSHSYKLSGSSFEASPVVVSVCREQTVSDYQLQVPREILAEEIRIAIVDKMAAELKDTYYEQWHTKELAHKLQTFMEEKNINLGLWTNQSLVSLSAELEELFRATKERSRLTREFGFSFMCSHLAQRAAVRGYNDIEKCLSFATPVMLRFLREAEEFSANHSLSLRPVDEDE